MDLIHPPDIDSTEPPPVLRFERRASDRWPVDAVGSAVEIAGQAFGRHHVLRLADYSDAGVGAVSESPIIPGTEVSVGVHAPGYPVRTGTVIRCQPCGAGYRIAVRFARALAA